METNIYISNLWRVVLFFLLYQLSAASGAVAQNNQPYLGRPAPGLTALRFPPDSLLATSTWMWHGSPAFTAGGLEMFWTEYSESGGSIFHLEIYTMRVENNNWSAIHRPEFADTTYKENNPCLPAGEDTLFYYSERTSSFINRVIRTTAGWMTPQPLMIPNATGYFHGNSLSVNKDLDLYFDESDQLAGESNICVSRFQNGNYQEPEVLGPEINSAYNEFCPFVDPDQNYIIFCSDRPGGFGGQYDLYISFKKPDQTWTGAINMGYEVNATGAFFPVVTPDKKYLFFNTGRSGDIGYNPYWISAAIIDTLRTIAGIKNEAESKTAVKLYQNQPNPFKNQTTLFFEFPDPMKISLEIFDQTGNSSMVLCRNRSFGKGKHSMTMDASQLPAGIYFCKLTMESGTALTRKMVIIR
ncbi:MAG: T9SS type A sorting domain-containing protein [Bacteroidetes bacterium]|nr:T9SS type A sorting domain-containing protein [Bacteroidota bacterium]